MLRTAPAKMSVEGSDVQTDEDFEFAEDLFSYSEHEKRTRKKKTSAKPPSFPKSPYLCRLNLSSRRAAVTAWRQPRASLGEDGVDTGDTTGHTASARLGSLSNGHDLSHLARSECDVTAEVLRQSTAARKNKPAPPMSNGSAEYRGKEEMYEENIRLKKSLHEQRSDNQQMKTKLRRLEEDQSKRERQIEELLDPTKGSEYARSFVDKKKEGSVVMNGLKQKILKLEQQCREKEKALSQLQSELRTTNVEELKITVETYFEEIQKLRMLLEAAEKRGRMESKASHRQKKTLGSTVLRLSDNLRQLKQENSALREELDIDSPVGEIKGYREWSKQRLVRRMLEVEKRLEHSRKHARSAKSSQQLDQGVQTMPTEILDAARAVAVATEAGVPMGTAAMHGEEVSFLRGRVNRLEEELGAFQETLISKDDKLKRQRTEREEMVAEAEKWKVDQINEREKERQEHRREREHFLLRIQSLEGGVCSSSHADPAAPRLASPAPARPQRDGGAEGEEGAGGGERPSDPAEESGDSMKKRGTGERRKERREKAARTVQASWRKHRERDLVMLQSTLRGHLFRQAQLRDEQRDVHRRHPPCQAIPQNSSSDVTSSADGELDGVALTMIQSSFRGHLVRCQLATERRTTPTTCPPTRSAELELHLEPDSGDAKANDSDDSDDIIISPSRPLRSREQRLL